MKRRRNPLRTADEMNEEIISISIDAFEEGDRDRAAHIMGELEGIDINTLFTGHMADTLFLSAWTSYFEDGSSPDETPEAGYQAADACIKLWEATNECTFLELYFRAVFYSDVFKVVAHPASGQRSDDWRARILKTIHKMLGSTPPPMNGEFASDMGHMAMGDGASWFDDHKKFPLKRPLVFEVHFDGEGMGWSGREGDFTVSGYEKVTDNLMDPDRVILPTGPYILITTNDDEQEIVELEMGNNAGTLADAIMDLFDDYLEGVEEYDPQVELGLVAIGDTTYTLVNVPNEEMLKFFQMLDDTSEADDNFRHWGRLTYVNPNDRSWSPWTWVMNVADDLYVVYTSDANLQDAIDEVVDEYIMENAPGVLCTTEVNDEYKRLIAVYLNKRSLPDENLLSDRDLDRIREEAESDCSHVGGYAEYIANDAWSYIAENPTPAQLAAIANEGR